jgi:Na+/H+ antiporter NhaD/arsenite permease-like protein
MGFIISSLSSGAGQPVNALYFWFSGLLSGFLDSAPAYLVFFNTASSGQPNPAQYMMTTAEQTLIAITAGASFMGALSYIGNAPNMIVKAIAEENGVRMPSFFGYCLWAFAFLTPLFMLVMYIFIK